MAPKWQKPKVLCVVDRRNSRTLRALENIGFRVLTTYSGDHAVAICVDQAVQAVVLEQSLFIEVEGWSVAQSIKMVRPKTCVILVNDSAPVSSEKPAGVDAVVQKKNLNTLPAVLHTWSVKRTSASAATYSSRRRSRRTVLRRTPGTLLRPR